MEPRSQSDRVEAGVGGVSAGGSSKPSLGHGFVEAFPAFSCFELGAGLPNRVCWRQVLPSSSSVF